jgi:hypothetical protein
LTHKTNLMIAFPHVLLVYADSICPEILARDLRCGDLMTNDEESLVKVLSDDIRNTIDEKCSCGPQVYDSTVSGLKLALSAKSHI